MIQAVDIGPMDRRITIQSPTEGRDATFNQINDGWGVVSTVWAMEAKNRTKDETFEGGKETTNRRTRFFIRYSTDVSGVTEKMRVLHGAETYEIEDVFISKREGYIRIDGIYKGIVT